MKSGLAIYAFSRAQVRLAFAYLDITTKQAIAEAIAKHILAFERCVPPIRKPWMSEDARMGLFDAAALVWTYSYQLTQVDGMDRKLP